MPETLVLITGLVKVLFVSVSVVALPTKVSVEVGKVKFDNGLLTIELKKIIPEHQQLRVYDID